MKSPYSGKPIGQWAHITQRLAQRHPLTLEILRETAVRAWQTLWKTRIGSGATSLGITEIEVPATVVGYFFEVLLSTELRRRFPGEWRGGAAKDEKDMVYIPKPEFSVEIKTSGQRGFKVYGNRSYGQRLSDDTRVKKEKSGYYLTANFYRQNLALLRFGWIDAEDWNPQQAPTGQMAGLKQVVYEHKLIAICGDYRQHAPVDMLHGVGTTTAQRFGALGIRSVGDLLRYEGELPTKLAQIRRSNEQFLEGCYDNSPKS